MKKILIFVFCLIGSVSVLSQSDSARSFDSYRIVFYNLENAFDIYNDSLTRDDEFTSFGKRYWGRQKYFKKINGIAKVVISIGGWEAPAIVGLCEVENKNVLFDLIYRTALKNWNYSFIHFDSEDPRGMDVAVLYRRDKLRLHKAKPFVIDFSSNHLNSKTRDILYASFVSLVKDTIHVLVNHWPSRYAGRVRSEPKRICASKRLSLLVKNLHDSLIDPTIVCMGDFNDNPTDPSILHLITDSLLIPCYDSCHYVSMGSLYYAKSGIPQWFLFDQIFVSSGLGRNDNPFYVKSFRIYNPEFLCQENEKLQKVPFRTWLGFKYQGGFSDHFPVYIDLYRR